MSFSVSRFAAPRSPIVSRSSCALLCLALPALLYTRADAQYTISTVNYDPAVASVFVINAQGQFVGVNTTGNIVRTGQGGQNAVDLGTLDTTTPINTPNAVNTSGQVAGYGYLSGDNVYHAFVSGPNGASGASGGIVDIGTLADRQDPTNQFGPYNSYANAINNKGQIVGVSDAVPDPNVFSPIRSHAFLYNVSTGTMTDLSGIPNASDPTGASFNSSANGINDTGLIVGDGDTDIGGGVIEDQAFAYQNGTYHTLGALNNTTQSIAEGVTNSGLIYGVSTYAPGDVSDVHGFIHSGLGNLASSDAIGTFGGGTSFIASVNDAGSAIGTAQDASGAYQPFLYRNHALTNLNALVPGSGWTLQFTYLITNDNRIFGEGLDPGGNDRFFLLTPAAAAVPEPGAFALLIGGGLSTLGLLARRRRAARF